MRIPDLRCLGDPGRVVLAFEVPATLLGANRIAGFGRATRADFQTLSREEIRQRFGTKLQKEILFYLHRTLVEAGPSATILDLGCGSGGSKRYLRSVGFERVLAVDYWSAAAEYLVDAHRLPCRDGSFDLVLATAALEHFYNPFVAMAEISRVLRRGGVLLASASFWESWHGRSCFHFTPDGLHVLCEASQLSLEDLWSGWGFLASVPAHALGLGRFKPALYRLQSAFDTALRALRGSDAAFQHRLRTSGSFGIYARKR